MKINKNNQKFFQNFFNILKPFSDKSPDWGIRWEIKKKNKKYSHGLLL